MKAILKGLGLLFVLALALLAAAAFWAFGEAQHFLVSAPSPAHDERIVLIERGSGPTVIAGQLEEAGVVTNADYFVQYLRYYKHVPKLRAGEFRFWTDLTPAQVTEILVNAPEVQRSITFPEGLRIEEMAKIVGESGFGDGPEYARLARDADFIAAAKLVEPAPETLEGYLVPETYNFPRGVDTRAVMQAQLDRFKEIWDARRLARAQELGMTVNEVVTLASIVEKETGKKEERPHIAGVFHNRLKKRMQLQSDPTIIYGLEDYDGDIRSSDIRKPHRWNTYVIPALPPTPIAGVGVAAIDAVLWPMETKDLYFVSRNDGSHHFSETYAEHAAMVRKFQSRRRALPR